MVKTERQIWGPNQDLGSKIESVFRGDTLNYTVKFRGIYTVGWKYHRKTPNTVG
jgi:hypothetical protein